MDINKVVYGGSFDPITNGHISIVQQAQLLFNKVYIVVATNPKKKYMFSLEERVFMIKSVFNQDVRDGDIEVIILPENEKILV